MSPWLYRTCLEPGCPARFPVGRGSRCPQHESKRKRDYNASRPVELQRFYNSTAWKKFRAYEKAARPICECTDERCKHRRWGTACTQPAAVLDHLIEPWKDWSRALDPTNTRTMCGSCHSSRTARTQSWHRG